MNCYCDLDQTYVNCCELFISGQAIPPDPVSLMRSRYSAFASSNVEYLKATWHPKFRPSQLTLEIEQKWIGLKILHSAEKSDSGEVKFVARYKINGKAYRLEEHSLFSRVDGRWYFLHAKS